MKQPVYYLLVILLDLHNYRTDPFPSSFGKILHSQSLPQRSNQLRTCLLNLSSFKELSGSSPRANSPERKIEQRDERARPVNESKPEEHKGKCPLIQAGLEGNRLRPQDQVAQVK
jgi:hypothetical protein